MSAPLGSKRLATSWLSTIYLSEVSFLFHLPLFISLTGNEDVYINTDEFDPNAGIQYLKRQFMHLKQWAQEQFEIEGISSNGKVSGDKQTFFSLISQLEQRYKEKLKSNTEHSQHITEALKKVKIIKDINNKIRSMSNLDADEHFQGNTPFFQSLYMKTQEIKRMFGIFFTAKERQKELWERKHPALPIFQLAMFFIRCGLNLAALILIFYDARESAGKSSQDILSEITTGETAKKGWNLILISFILYLFSYLHQRYHLINFERHAQIQDQVLTLPSKLYWLSHVSIINFSLDLPGFVVPDVKISHIIICCINITAAGILIFTLFAIEPFQKAWGCYPHYDNYRDYDYGMCPGFFSNDQARLQPVCDQPGVRCGKGLVQANDFFNKELTICHTMLSVSFALYMLSITVKLDYFRVALDTATRKVHAQSTGTKLKVL